MDSLATPSNAYLPRLLRVDPLLRVYLTDKQLSAVRIGHQFSDLESTTIRSRTAHYDQLAADGDVEFEHSESLHITRNDIVKVTVDHNRSSHMPTSPATIRIEVSSGAVTNLLLPPSSRVAEIAELFTAFYPATVAAGEPRTIPTTKQSPQSIFRQYLVLGTFFAVTSVVFLWYSLQQLTNLPIVITVPPNIWGAIHCFRRARTKWLSMSHPQSGG